ncbi:MAG: Gx transporter family protein [Nitrospinae bacterium]|nr:Gx transporter family protein [Nitrospinota bacterium]
MALLVGLGAALHRVEALLPLPSPWIKLGLANIMTMIAIAFLGTREAFAVTFLRVVLGSILGGTFLGPTFLLSLAGGMAGTFAMVLVYRKGRGTFSMVGVSVAGACAHTAAIVVCVYGLFVRQNAFLNLFPFFLTFALISGVATGFLADALARHLVKEGVSLK